MTPPHIKLLVAYYAGSPLPAMGLAVLVGFLAWSWKRFWVTLAVAVLATVAVQLFVAIHEPSAGDSTDQRIVRLDRGISSWSDYKVSRSPDANACDYACNFGKGALDTAAGVVTLMRATVAGVGALMRAAGETPSGNEDTFLKAVGAAGAWLEDKLGRKPSPLRTPPAPGSKEDFWRVDPTYDPSCNNPKSGCYTGR